VPRHQQQQSVRPAGQQFLVGRQHLLLFARVRAAGNPRRPFAPERCAQRMSPLGHLGTQLHVELDIADHARPGTLSSDGDEALRILDGLSSYERTGGENPAKEVAEAPVARNRLRRQPRTGEHQRHAATFALRK